MDALCVWPAVLVMWVLRSGSVGVGQLWGLESSSARTSGLEGPGLERPVSSIGCCQLRWRPLGQRGKGWRVFISGEWWYPLSETMEVWDKGEKCENRLFSSVWDTDIKHTQWFVITFSWKPTIDQQWYGIDGMKSPVKTVSRSSEKCVEELLFEMFKPWYF